MTVRFASSLCVGTMLVFGAFACGTSNGAAVDAGPDSWCWDCTGCFGSDVSTDTDTGTIAFELTTFDLAAAVRGDGFNLDGVQSDASTTPIAEDAAGCYQKDVGPTGGVRNVDARFAVALDAAHAAGLDLATLLGTGIASGRPRLRVALDHWNGTLSDCVVGVELQGDSGSGFVTLGRMSTSVTNGMTPMFAPGSPIRFDVPITVTDPSLCTPGTYGAGSVSTAPACASSAYSCSTTLPLAIAGVKLRVHLVKSSHLVPRFDLVTSTPAAPVTNPTILGGYVVFWDTSTDRPACTDTSLTGTTFEAALQKSACDLGLGAKWASDLCPAFAENLDLHETGGSLSACAPGATTTTSNANAISFAAYVGN